MNLSPTVALTSGLSGRCCSRACDYRPESVQHHLDVLLAMERAGEDPCLRSPTARYGLDSGGRGGDGPATLWDIQRAVKALRAEHREVTATSVAQHLCPFALDHLDADSRLGS